jgi:hypothetical protein
MWRVRFETRPILAAISSEQKQHEFALDLAKNRTAEERQVALQQHITSNLTIRQAGARTQFRRAVRFGREDRADRRRGQRAATLRVLGATTAATTDLFRRFGSMILRQDDGGVSTSRALYRTQNNQFTPGGFIIPAPGLRTSTRGVPLSLYPAAIGLSSRSLKYEDSDDLARQYKGGKKKRGGFRKGTRYFFVKEGVGIFQRQQLGKQSEYDAVWFFRTRITLPKRLDLAGTFQQGLAEQLRANYAGFYAFAQRTAR